MAASGETTIDFSTPGINYKGRIQYNNTTNAFDFFSMNSSGIASLVLTDTATNIYNPTQFWYGLQSGLADANGNFPCGSINQSGDVLTYGNIQCANIVCSGTLTATNIYNKTQVDGLLTSMASTSYVDSAIASKASTYYVDSGIASAVLNPDA